MREIKILVILLLIASCSQRNTSKNETQKNQRIEYVSYKNSIPNLDTTQKGFTKCLDLDFKSLPSAQEAVNKCISSFADKEKDSIYIFYQKAFYNAVNKINDSLESKFSIVLGKISNGENDSMVIKFNQVLDKSGLTLLMTEGSYYVDVQSWYFYDLFKGKISKSLEEYLRLRSIELASPFSEDAMLLVSYEKLYDRVVTWEDFINNYPDFFRKAWAVENFQEYLSVLLTGMDNTPAFNREDGILNPELKSLYEKVINHTDSRESTQIITQYYNLLKENEFKEPNGLNDFMVKYNLYSMKGVQPSLR
jgi:hypothetical protein